jgi:hypothetical protein
MDDRPYVNEGIWCYHEAGHAVAFWHYGIRLRYVTMRPPVGSGHAGQTVTVDRAEITGDEIDTEMRCAAAGEIAQTRVFTTRAVPTDDSLIRRFTRDAATVTANPDSAVNDGLIFAKLGLARDDEIRDIAPDTIIGPASWVPVWREAEQLIRFELWPAVEAVAEELRRCTIQLSHEDVDALAAAGLGRPAQALTNL